nr:MAG TPA: hypothetical protein [Caudoviricetes sp.]
MGRYSPLTIGYFYVIIPSQHNHFWIFQYLINEYYVF